MAEQHTPTGRGVFSDPGGEYLTARDGVSSRPSRFKTEAAARAAITQSTKEKP